MLDLSTNEKPNTAPNSAPALDTPHPNLSTVYAELRRVARRNLSSHRWMATLQTTSLANESFIRLQSTAASHAVERAHYFNLASRIMRQIICDYARRRMRRRRLIDESVTIDDVDNKLNNGKNTEANQLIALDDALKDLERHNPRYAKVIECRFFAGLTESETAEALGVSSRTVERDWNKAREWLAVQLEAK